MVGAISACRPFLPFLVAASSARFPASLAAISPGVVLCAGAVTPPLPAAIGVPLPTATGAPLTATGPLAAGNSLPPLAGMAGLSKTPLAFFGSDLAGILAAGFPLSAGFASLTKRLDFGVTFLPAFAAGLRAGFLGAAFRLAECLAFLAAGFAFEVVRAVGRLAFAFVCLAALRVAGWADRGFAFGRVFDLGRALRVGFAVFLAMVILDGNCFPDVYCPDSWGRSGKTSNNTMHLGPPGA